MIPPRGEMFLRGCPGALGHVAGDGHQDLPGVPPVMPIVANWRRLFRGRQFVGNCRQFRLQLGPL